MATPSKQRHDTAKPTTASLEISTTRTKFPQYVLASKRHESFTEASMPWPETSPVKVENLVAAGFVYTGVGDSVCCFHCGGGLGNWETGDDPMEQHDKWYPSCQYVLTTKSKTYTHGGKACENPELTSTGRPNVKHSSLDNSVLQQEQGAIQAAAKFGYSEENIKIAACLFRERNGASSKFKGSDLVSILMEMEDDPDLALHANVSGSCAPTSPSDDIEFQIDDLQSLMLENGRLKDLLNCKICLDRRADIVYLPCGHIFSCPQCTRALDRCPICRSAIDGLVKAKFANTRHEVAFDQAALKKE